MREKRETRRKIRVNKWYRT